MTLTPSGRGHPLDHDSGAVVMRWRSGALAAALRLLLAATPAAASGQPADAGKPAAAGKAKPARAPEAPSVNTDVAAARADLFGGDAEKAEAAAKRLGASRQPG